MKQQRSRTNRHQHSPRTTARNDSQQGGIVGDGLGSPSVFSALKSDTNNCASEGCSDSDIDNDDDDDDDDDDADDDDSSDDNSGEKDRVYATYILPRVSGLFVCLFVLAFGSKQNKKKRKCVCVCVFFFFCSIAYVHHKTDRWNSNEKRAYRSLAAFATSGASEYRTRVGASAKARRAFHAIAGESFWVLALFLNLSFEGENTKKCLTQI